MNYNNYTLEDFLADESFVNYCLETNEEDFRYWEDVLLKFPDLSRNIRKAKELCLLLAVRVDKKDKNIAFAKLQKDIARQEKRHTQAHPSVRSLFAGRKRWISIAASFILATCAYVLLKVDNSVEQAETYALKQSTPITYTATLIDERKKITLLDGTKVLLNGSSQLHISKEFNKQHRVVWLEGEAFFEVAKDKSKPFVVRTASTVTTALGTSFKVKNYANQPEPYVILRSGSVKVSHINAKHQAVATKILKPGQQALVKEENQLSILPFEDNKMKDWFERKLVFEAAAYDEIKSKLFDIYGISLIAEPSIVKSIAFTGQFDNEKLTEVLDAIAFSNRVKFKIVGNKIIMTKLVDN